MGVWRDLDRDFRLKAMWCYGADRGLGVLLRLLLTDSTMAMVYYRLMQWARRHRLAPLEMLMNRLNGFFCNCYIGRGAEFGPGFVLVQLAPLDQGRTQLIVQSNQQHAVEQVAVPAAEQAASPAADIAAGARA